MLQPGNAFSLLDQLSSLVEQSEGLEAARRRAAVQALTSLRQCLEREQKPSKETFDELTKAISGESSLVEYVVLLTEQFGYLPSA